MENREQGLSEYSLLSCNPGCLTWNKNWVFSCLYHYSAHRISTKILEWSKRPCLSWSDPVLWPHNLPLFYMFLYWSYTCMLLFLKLPMLFLYIVKFVVILQRTFTRPSWATLICIVHFKHGWILEKFFISWFSLITYLSLIFISVLVMVAGVYREELTSSHEVFIIAG